MSSDQKRAALAVVLSGSVLFLWQTFFAPKQEIVDAPKVEQAKTNQAVAVKETIVANNTVTNQDSAPVQVESQSVELVNEDYQVNMTNYFQINDMKGVDTRKSVNEIIGQKNGFEFYVLDNNVAKRLALNFEESGSRRDISGSDLNLGVSFKATLNNDGRLTFNLSSQKLYKYRIIFNSAEAQMANQRYREFLVYANNEVDRYQAGSEDNGTASAKWIGVDYDYHLFALIFPQASPVLFKSNEQGQMIFDFTTAAPTFSADILFAEKNYDYLKTAGDSLHTSVDFGIFGIIAVPILRGLQFFYKYIPNYGVAIILLTLIIRLITFPLQFKSMKGMKKMQLIQPEVTKIKEKYKDDPRRMQAETMELFKKSGVNPMSGCFPLLLQMPVFFAFYQVLYSAVELVGAPFLGWIADLSAKDPYYALPVLMAVAMFGQQKMMPSASADPTQKKIMMFMPIIFGLIMKDLPAGLTLYIFVSTLFGIVQQVFVNKKVETLSA